jgi:hypothetical protein
MSVDLGINRRSIDVAESIYNQVNTAINQYFNDLKLESSMYLSAISAAVQKIAGIDYAAFEFTLQSFATSKAGVLEIPVPKNAKLSSCVLKKLDGTVLFSGDGTSKVVNEVFHFSQQGLPDQKCTLSYTTTDLNVLTGHRQIAVLKSLQVDGVFT